MSQCVIVVAFRSSSLISGFLGSKLKQGMLSEFGCWADLSELPSLSRCEHAALKL